MCLNGSGDLEGPAQLEALPQDQRLLAPQRVIQLQHLGVHLRPQVLHLEQGRGQAGRGPR